MILGGFSKPCYLVAALFGSVLIQTASVFGEIETRHDPLPSNSREIQVSDEFRRQLGSLQLKWAGQEAPPLNETILSQVSTPPIILLPALCALVAIRRRR